MGGTGPKVSEFGLGRMGHNEMPIGDRHPAHAMKDLDSETSPR